MTTLRSRFLVLSVGGLLTAASLLSATAVYFLKSRLEGELRVRALALTRSFLYVASGALDAPAAPAVSNYLNSLLADPDLEEACLLDPKGGPIACRERGSGSFALDPALLSAALAGFTPQIRTARSGGRRWLVCYQRVWVERPAIRTLGAVALRFSAYRIERELRDAVVLLLTATAALFGLTLLGTLFFSIRLTRPLEALRAAAEALGRGEVPKGLPVRSPDEIGRLAVMFGRMAKSIDQSQTDLRRSFAEQAEKAAQLEKAYGELQALRERLTHAEKLTLMGRIVAGVAHELNNPLTGILGYSELVLLDEAPRLSATAKEDLEKVRKEALRCKGIVQGLSAFARQRPSERVPVDLNVLLTETLSLEAYLLRSRGIETRLELAPELPRVLADPQQLQQVFLNLIANAQQAISERSPRGILVLRTRLRGPRVVAEVEDDGPGIPPELLERIFEPFFTTKGVGKGTGLGLSISYGIVEDHGGSIRAENAEGGGARFVVELPPTSALAAAPRPPARTAAASLRVLVVDDEAPVRDVTLRLLERLGHKPAAAADGLEAQSRLGESDFDAVLSDIRMPRLDGRRLFEWMRKERPELEKAWVFLTGSVGDETRAFLEATGRPILLKPFDSDALEKALAALRPRAGRD